MTVEQTIDQVQVARTATSGANRETTCDMRIRAGRERGDLLVPDMQPLNAAMAAQRIGEAIEAVAHDSVDALDTAAARVSTIWSATVRVMIFSLRSGAWFQWLSSERLTARGEVFGPGARPGLISSGLRGAMGLGVGRVTVAPFSSPIRGTQLGDGCGP